MRRWRKDLLDTGVTEVTVAKAYRLLKAILNTAVDDGLIRRNPCRIKGAGQEKSAERPVLTVPQVYALAAATDERYRVLVLLAAFTSLRWGELAALRCSDIDAQARTVRVTRQLNERDGGGFRFGPPKSEAGVRIVAIPELITPDLTVHIMTYARPGDDGLVFASAGRRAAKAHQLPAPVLGACPGGGRAPGDALSRSAPYREHARGGRGREPPGADGAYGPLHDPGRDGVPAWGDRAAACHRGRAEQAGSGAAGPGEGEAIGHATGTAAPVGIVTACLVSGERLPDLGFEVCAPTATRTRDLLLRRHSRNPAWCRLVWPDVPLCSSGSGWMWPDVAQDLGSLAPR